MQDGIIILPTDLDAEPVNPADAARSFLDAYDQQTAELAALRAQAINTAADLAALKVQEIRRKAAEAAEADAAAAAHEPPRTAADTAAAELAALREMLDTVQSLPELQPIPDQLDGLPMPLDRVTKQIFAPEQNEKGELQRRTGEYKVRQNKSKQSPIIAVLDFGTPDTVQRLDRLTAYDRRVLLAVGGLCENGIMRFSFTQLFHAMGGTTKPKAQQREQMRNALHKMRFGVKVELPADDGGAALKLDFTLLDSVVVSVNYQGQTAEAIQLTQKPLWLKIAEARKQITALPFAVFADGLSLTENSIAVSEYLLTEIAHMKRQKTFSRQMRLDSIAAGAGVDIAHREKRRRLADKVEKKLTHYAATGYIQGFAKYENGYTISP